MLLPLLIFAAFACALLLLIDSFLNIGLFRITSGTGAFFAVAAVLHVTVLASDMRSLLQSVINSGRQQLQDNPFAGLAESLSALMINAFQLKPGNGLWVLAGCLTAVAVVVNSGVLQKFRVVPVEVPNSQPDRAV